jgi:hypothetical protein
MEITDGTIVDDTRLVICPRCGRRVDIAQIVDRGEVEEIRCELCELEETEDE